MFKFEDMARSKRTPDEVASSLQSMLAHHRIETNVLKTRAHIDQVRPNPNREFILTPSHQHSQQHQSRFQHRAKFGMKTNNHNNLPEKFFTNSDIFPHVGGNQADAQQQPQQVNINKRQDPGEDKPKTSFRETAIIALKLSQSILNLYKTVSPYLHGEKVG